MRYTAPDHEAAMQLIYELLSEDSRYDEETWPEIAEALDRDRRGGEEQRMHKDTRKMLRGLRADILYTAIVEVEPLGELREIRKELWKLEGLTGEEIDKIVEEQGSASPSGEEG